MPHRLVEDALATWRDGERLLAVLPPLSADHETVALAVVRVRAVHHRLTTTAMLADRSLRSARATIADAKLTLAMIRARHLSDGTGADAEVGSSD